MNNYWASKWENEYVMSENECVESENENIMSEKEYLVSENHYIVWKWISNIEKEKINTQRLKRYSI